MKVFGRKWPDPDEDDKRIKNLEMALKKIVSLCKQRIKVIESVDDDVIISIGLQALEVAEKDAATWRDDDSPQSETTFGVKAA